MQFQYGGDTNGKPSIAHAYVSLALKLPVKKFFLIKPSTYYMAEEFRKQYIEVSTHSNDL